LRAEASHAKIGWSKRLLKRIPMLKNLLFVSTTLLSFSSSSIALGTEYVLDNAHSAVEFKIKHLMISNVKGSFKSFKGKGSGNFSKDQASIDSIEMQIDADSIDTNEAKRDAHLKTPEIFNVAKFKTIDFKSTKIEYKGKFPFKIHGNMTLHGITKPVTFDVEWGGFIVDPWKNERIAFEAETKINRKDFGINWNMVAETMVGDDVNITIHVEAMRKKEVTSQK
jgi:polyisoprenoid-binding protein YceI